MILIIIYINVLFVFFQFNPWTNAKISVFPIELYGKVFALWNHYPLPICTDQFSCLGRSM